MIKNITKEIEKGTFPRFSLFVAPQGMGKKSLMKEIPKLFCVKNVYQLQDVKVDTIRKMISDSYKTADVVFYIIPDAEKMSEAAKNALLKVVEEPPNRAYFLMSVSSLEQTLGTIKSRARIYRLNSYTVEEKTQALDKLHIDARRDYFLSMCDSIDDIKKLSKIDIDEFLALINKTIDNIAEISGANAFKLHRELNIKDEDDKYDLRLFFKAIMNESFRRATECAKESDFTGVSVYSRLVSDTSKSLQELSITGVNKMMLVDMWIFNARKTLGELD